MHIAGSLFVTNIKKFSPAKYKNSHHNKNRKSRCEQMNNTDLKRIQQ